MECYKIKRLRSLCTVGWLCAAEGTHLILVCFMIVLPCYQVGHKRCAGRVMKVLTMTILYFNMVFVH